MQSWLERVFVLSTLILEIIKSRRNNFKSRATNHVYFKCLHIAGGANKHQVLKPSKRKPIRNKKKKVAFRKDSKETGYKTTCFIQRINRTASRN